MSKRNILCVIEGKKTELQILERLNELFIKKEIKFIPFSTNIYVVYSDYLDFRKNEKDREFEMFIFLKKYDKEKTLNNKKRKDFTDIFLFMDLDRHHLDKITNEVEYERLLKCLPDMLELFNNSIENGKLFISYPMVEAFKHPLNGFQTLGLSIGKRYKHYVAQICNKKIENFNNHPLNKDEWSYFLIPHICATNFLLNQDFCYPNDYKIIHTFHQKIIYQKQCEDYMEKDNQCLILSPFALFLLEYLGKPLFLEWQAFDN